jgi:hypothetical protein
VRWVLTGDVLPHLWFFVFARREGGGGSRWRWGVGVRMGVCPGCGVEGGVGELLAVCRGGGLCRVANVSSWFALSGDGCVE